jgi:DNA-directed RNA polymerase subunit F
MGALTVLIAAIWFWAYFRPARNRMADLRTETAEREERLATEQREAEERERIARLLRADRAELTEEWDQVQREDLPSDFSPRDVLRHIEDVIYPHTRFIEVEFNASELREDDELYSTIVTIEFETTYWQLLTILHNLVQGGLGNRVVTYEIDVFPMDESELRDILEHREYGVLNTAAAEFIPEDILTEIRAFLHRTVEESPGLFRLFVEMDVEYLSMRPGLVSEDDLRASWGQQQRR